MESLFANPGLWHIGEKIIRNLDFKTQLTCRLVNKSWNHVLQIIASNSKADLITKLKLQIPSNSDLTKRLDNWTKFLQTVLDKLDNPWINIYLQKHLKQLNKNGFCSVLEYFFVCGNEKIVDFIYKEMYS